jgi:hypothetical protein
MSMATRTTDAAVDVVEITATPEIGRQLDAAEAEGKRPVLVYQGVRYALNAVEDEAQEAMKRDLFANYDPEAVRASMRAAAGS